jgi:hypothetical protein
MPQSLPGHPLRPEGGEEAILKLSIAEAEQAGPHTWTGNIWSLKHETERLKMEADMVASVCGTRAGEIKTQQKERGVGRWVWGWQTCRYPDSTLLKIQIPLPNST